MQFVQLRRYASTHDVHVLLAFAVLVDTTSVPQSSASSTALKLDLIRVVLTDCVHAICDAFSIGV
jgi:hypothetical protein